MTEPIRSSIDLGLFPAQRAAHAAPDKRDHIRRDTKDIGARRQGDIDGPPIGIELVLEIAQALEVVELSSVPVDERA